MYKGWETKVTNLNTYIEQPNKDNPKRIIKKIEKWDFLTCHALLIGASCYYQSGSMLFGGSQKDESRDKCDIVLQKANFDKYMKLYRFK